MTPTIPMFLECACGHLGSKHRDDGSCARCECLKFTRPTRAYTQPRVLMAGRPFKRGRGSERTPD